MPLKSRLFLFILATSLLVPVVAFAGWGDAIKEAGSQIADQKATEMGLPSPSETVAGIKEVLNDGATSAVDTLGTEGGFMDNALARIPLPDLLQDASGDSGGLLSSMNKAAESVIPESAGSIFNAIKDLNVTNPTEVVSGGGNDSITRFFESKSRPTLKKVMSPLMESAMKNAGVGNYLDTFSSALASSGTPFDMNGYVTDRTLDGIFAMMSAKEESLRADGGGTSQLLQKLF